ncbi:MAG: hypothetical protein IPL77_21930 [Flavobacteriales bacterium]|nr:hypothetical protein [Flavobacteriales bacterium]
MTQDCFLPEWTLLTEMPDGDMEQNNTTDWGSSNATLSKVTAEPSLWGKRWLRVTTTDAGGYAENAAALAVVPGATYHISAIARPTAATTTATVRAYDNTNAATIDLKTYTGSARDGSIWKSPPRLVATTSGYGWVPRRMVSPLTSMRWPSIRQRPTASPSVVGIEQGAGERHLPHDMDWTNFGRMGPDAIHDPRQ